MLQSPTTPCQCENVGECRHTQVRYTLRPLANQPQYYSALLHYVSFTSGRMQTYPGQMYYHLSLNWVVQSPTTPCQFDMWKNADIPRSQVTPSLHQTSCYRALLHQVSLPCGRMQMYPGHMYPLPQSNLVLQSPTTPGQFDKWQDADVPRWGVPWQPTNQT